MHTEKLVHTNGIDLCVQEFGAPTGPGLLLIGGAASSMDWWEDEFCERLAAGDRRVVRYDFRDTGQSTASPAGRPNYTGSDLQDDALALIDALGLAPAHLIGISMGGGIAQQLALAHPAKVATLTLISTSGSGPDLPPPTPQISKAFASPPPPPDWSDREATIGYLVAGLEPFAGGLGLDEERARRLLTRIYDRTTDIAASQTNHWILEGGEASPVRLSDVTAPTLVLHGTDDPLFPLAHGEALARAIPGARLLPLPGVGHEYPPPPVWDIVIDAILRHTEPAQPKLGE